MHEDIQITLKPCIQCAKPGLLTHDAAQALITCWGCGIQVRFAEIVRENLPRHEAQVALFCKWNSLPREDK